MGKWGRLVIHLVVGAFRQAAASTQLFFAALQRRHLLRLNLHSIQSFYLHPKKKTRRTLPNSPRPQGVLHQSAQRCQGGGLALIRQTPPLMHRRGELVTPHHSLQPFPPHTPLSVYFSLKTSQPRTELASLRGDAGWEAASDSPSLFGD